MKVVAQPFVGVMVLEPDRFEDERGFFLESFEQERYRELGIVEDFVQDNHSRSRKNVLRGLHFTKNRPQAQIELSDEGIRQIYMAHGFAHGFCVLSDWADLHYKVSQRYDPHDEGGLLWNDPDVGIRWPTEVPQVTARDATYPRIKDLSQAQLPHHLPAEQ